MEEAIIRQITQRMSLRKPQALSLEILAKLANLLPMEKGHDLKMALERLQQAFPNVSEFERSFPNVCFALATGVGKTRLMGAMIAYLAQVKGTRHFLVLAPNNTITEKLVREFSNPNDAKYVFKGLPEFANRYPHIITEVPFF